MTSEQYWRLRAIGADLSAAERELLLRVQATRERLEGMMGLPDLRAKMRSAVAEAGLNPDVSYRYDDDRQVVEPVAAPTGRT